MRIPPPPLLPALILLAVVLAPGGLLAQTPLLFSFHGGGAFPVGEVADHHDAGFSLGLGLALELSPRLEVEGAVHLHRLARNDAATLDRVGWRGAGERERFRAGGGYLDGGHRTLAGGALHVRFLPTPPGRRVSPFLQVGMGLARESLAEVDTHFIGEWESYEGTAGTGITGSVGAGLRIGLGSAVDLVTQGAVLASGVEADRTLLVPLQVGLAIHLGERNR